MRQKEGRFRVRGLAFASLGELVRTSSTDYLTAKRERQEYFDEAGDRCFTVRRDTASGGEVVRGYVRATASGGNAVLCYARAHHKRKE